MGRLPGRLQESPRRARGLAELEAAARALRPHAVPRTRAGQQRRTMLATVRRAIDQLP